MLEWLKLIAVGVFFAVFCAEVLRFLKKPVAPEYEVLETFENEPQALVVQSRLRGVGIASDIFCQNYGMKKLGGLFIKSRARKRGGRAGNLGRRAVRGR